MKACYRYLCVSQEIAFQTIQRSQFKGNGHHKRMMEACTDKLPFWECHLPICHADDLDLMWSESLTQNKKKKKNKKQKKHTIYSMLVLGLGNLKALWGNQNFQEPIHYFKSHCVWGGLLPSGLPNYIWNMDIICTTINTEWVRTIRWGLHTHEHQHSILIHNAPAVAAIKAFHHPHEGWGNVLLYIKRSRCYSLGQQSKLQHWSHE